MNSAIVTRAGSSLALREPIVWGRDLAQLEEAKGTLAYVQSAAVTVAGSLWAFADVARSQEPRPVTGLSMYQPIAHEAEREELTKKQGRLRNVARLLDRWMADTSGYDEDTWPKLKKAMEEDRLSSRRLFDE
ncbi:MAG: hypothetical protein E8D45_11505 [Nitrospira sp.]|nr:MAG: hypothetical protein E8D45_11505 [Nitrospira sp.]